MKLINRTYLNSIIWLIPVTLIGSVFCFYMIRYINYEEADEFLTYEMNRLINYHEINNDLPEFHQVAAVIKDLKYDSPFFKDTLILEPGDNEMVPYRELYFTINHNNKNFTIILRQLLPGNDDILEGTLLIVTGFLLLTVLVLFLMIRYISGKIWNPFYKTLNTLTKYQITGPLPELQDSSIDEFNLLNKTALTLLRKISDDYRRTKEFNENASHELQTHLAIIRANTEKLLNSQLHMPEVIHTIYNSTVKLSQAQKSLMLLSKIGNLEYNNNISLDISEIVQQSLLLFQETMQIRNISLIQKTESCVQFMDAGLAEIMVNNLLKNAVKYNIDGGYISIFLSQESFIVENSGLPFEGDPEILLERFSKGEKGNLGLGLSIVKKICELCNFGITYQIRDTSIHRLSILFRIK